MRNIVIVAAGLGLAGCSSFSMPEMFKSTPPAVTVQMESLPPGAEARTSTGQSCKTPCSVSVAAENSFSVTFTLPKYQPETVPVQVIRDPENFGATIDPNPVYAELQPAAPSAKGRKGAPKAAAAPKTKKPPRAAPAAAAPADTSPFPPPPGR